MSIPFIRFFREQRLRRDFEPLRKKLEGELSAFLEQPCQLVPARGKGGYDRLFYVEAKGQRRAMMRMKNDQAGGPTEEASDDIRRALKADERLAHEWQAYSALSKKGCSPRPIWRTPETIVASYHPFQRASEVLKAEEKKVWTLLPQLFALVREMHAAQVVHMDLNLGNILVDPSDNRMLAIDFEYVPVPELSFEQACLCDYLRLINDLLRPRRGGRELQRDMDRFIGMFPNKISPALQGIDGTRVKKHFPNVMREEKVLLALESLYRSDTV